MNSGSLPDMFTLVEQNERLILTRCRTEGNPYLMTAFLPFWWFVMPPYLLHILIDIELPNPLQSGPYIHGIVGFGLVYITAVFWFNHTRLVVENTGLTLKKGPFPWFGGTSVKADDINQMYSEGISVRNWYGKPAVLHEISVQRGDKKLIPIVRDIGTAEQARFLKDKFQAYLGAGDWGKKSPPAGKAGGAV